MKRVRFSNTIKVYRYEDIPESRKPYWEVVARDRFRFNKRISDVEKKIRYVFCPEHRSNIIKEMKNMSLH